MGMAELDAEIARREKAAKSGKGAAPTLTDTFLDNSLVRGLRMAAGSLQPESVGDYAAKTAVEIPLMLRGGNIGKAALTAIPKLGSALGRVATGLGLAGARDYSRDGEVGWETVLDAALLGAAEAVPFAGSALARNLPLVRGSRKAFEAAEKGFAGDVAKHADSVKSIDAATAGAKKVADDASQRFDDAINVIRSRMPRGGASKMFDVPSLASVKLTLDDAVTGLRSLMASGGQRFTQARDELLAELRRLDAQGPAKIAGTTKTTAGKKPYADAVVRKATPDPFPQPPAAPTYPPAPTPPAAPAAVKLGRVADAVSPFGRAALDVAATMPMDQQNTPAALGGATLAADYVPSMLERAARRVIP